MAETNSYISNNFSLEIQIRWEIFEHFQKGYENVREKYFQRNFASIVSPRR